MDNKLDPTEKGYSVDVKPGTSRYFEDEEFVNNFPEEKRKKALRKVDWRLTPMLMLLYLLAHLDRANIGNAKVEGLEDDLGMAGNDYNVATGIFFIPYILFEIPSNYVLKKYFSLRPSLWIGTICLAWGIVMTLTGCVRNFAELMITRVFLGATEAGFFPGAILLCSSWYVKHELQTRVAIFYIASAISGAISGLLAYGIAKMDGVGGYEGWRWIFILEGLATVVLAVITYICLPDSPQKSKWLDEEEQKYFITRILLQDGGADVAEHSEFSWNLLLKVLKDYKIYVFGIIYWGATAPIYGLKFTLPQIITGMGYESANAQLLSMPPYFVGGICAWIVGVIADKFRWRMPFIAAPLVVQIVAYAVLFALDVESNVAACYFAVCLACGAVYPIPPGVNSWCANNLAGAEKRSLGIALFIMMTNIGSIIGSFMYKNNEAPKYPTGYGVAFSLSALGVVLSLGIDYILWQGNKKKEKWTKDEIFERYTEQELADLGDDSPLYKYVL